MKNYKVLLNPWYLEKSFNWMFRECCWTGSFGPLLFSNNSWPRVAGFAAWLCLKYMWHCDSSRALAADGNCVCIQTTRGQITLMILSCFWLKVFSLAGSQAARLWDTGFYASVAVCCDKYLFASVMSEGQIHLFFFENGINLIYSDDRAVNSGVLISGLGFVIYLRAHHFTSLVAFTTDKQRGSWSL